MITYGLNCATLGSYRNPQAHLCLPTPQLKARLRVPSCINPATEFLEKVKQL